MSHFVLRGAAAHWVCTRLWVAQKDAHVGADAFVRPARQSPADYRGCTCLWVAQRFTAAIRALFAEPAIAAGGQRGVNPPFLSGLLARLRIP